MSFHGQKPVRWAWSRGSLDREIPKGLVHLLPFWGQGECPKPATCLLSGELSQIGSPLNYARTQQGWAAAGDGGGAYEFTASQLSILQGHNEGTMIWGLRPRTGNNTGGIFALQDTGGFNGEFAMSSGQWRIKSTGGATLLRVNFPVGTLDRPHCYAFTGGPGGNRLYQDGRRLRAADLTYLTGSASTNAWLNDVVNSDAAYLMAVNFTGLVYDDLVDMFWFELYDRQLSDAEILYRIRDLYGVIRHRRPVYTVAGSALVRVRDETEQVSEASARALAISRPQAETEQTAEGSVRTLQLNRAADESAQIGEAIVRALALSRLRGETGQVTEARIASQTLNRHAAETEQLSEGLAQALGRTQVFSETAQIATGATTALGKTQVFTETAESAESLATATGLVRESPETAQVAETSARSRSLARLLGETVTGTELNVPARVLVRPLGEVEALQETRVPSRVLLRQIDEALQLAEALATALSQGIEIQPLEFTAYRFGVIDLSAELAQVLTLDAHLNGSSS